MIVEVLVTLGDLVINKRLLDLLLNQFLFRSRVVLLLLSLHLKASRRLNQLVGPRLLIRAQCDFVRIADNLCDFILRQAKVFQRLNLLDQLVAWRLIGSQA